MQNVGSLVQEILKIHIEQMSSNLGSVSLGKIPLALQIYPEDRLIEFAKAAGALFASEPALLILRPPIVVVGDLHGHILDLYRILTCYDLPPNTSYLFLGDIVDRGPFSLETLCLVYALKLSFPNSIFLVRGNHEFRETSLYGGFYKDITQIYPRGIQVFEAFTNSFQYIPLAAKIGNYLCVHAGLSPEFVSISQINQIPRPILNYNNPILCGILWSDPSLEPETFTRSRRGTGFYFGENSLSNFLAANGLDILIRGHECVNGAVSHFKGRVITIFSASSYCGTMSNNSGAMLITDSFEIKIKIFEPLNYLTRDKAIFTPYGTGAILQKAAHITHQRSVPFPKGRISYGSLKAYSKHIIDMGHIKKSQTGSWMDDCLINDI